MRYLSLVAMMVFSVTLAGRAAEVPATVPAKPALWVQATTVEKAKPGEQVTVTVTITNTTDGPLTIDIPSMWWAKSDHPLVIFPSWPARGGIGPVMTFKSETIEAGKSFSRPWNATISSDAPAGELSFKVSLTIKRGAGPVQSEAVKLVVEKP